MHVVLFNAFFLYVFTLIGFIPEKEKLICIIKAACFTASSYLSIYHKADFKAENHTPKKTYEIKQADLSLSY